MKELPILSLQVILVVANIIAITVPSDIYIA
jgi:hypothetical protein